MFEVVYFARVRSRAVFALLVTLIQPLFGNPELGRVIPESVMVISATPSVGGLTVDFEPLTSKSFTMPCMKCGEPSGAGTKHNAA